MQEVWPDWLDAHRIPDAKFAQAYDCLGASGRALIKEQIAFLHAWYGESFDRESSRTRTLKSGCQVRENRGPANWTLAVLPEDVFSLPDLAAALTAALMPSILAGVEQTGVCLMGKNEHSEPALAALELLGLDSVFSLDRVQTRNLLSELGRTTPVGRIIGLGKPELFTELACPTLYPLFSSPRNTVTTGTGAGHLWFWPDLNLAFFRNCKYSISLS